MMNKEETLDWLYRLRSEIYVYMPKEWLIPMNNALDMAIKALEQEPKTKIEESNFSQEQYLADIQSAYDCGKSVLDKIRDEIETKYGQCDICEYFEDYDYEENDISEYRPIGNIADILQILDKYRAESEKA